MLLKPPYKQTYEHAFRKEAQCLLRQGNKPLLEQHISESAETMHYQKKENNQTEI